MHKSPQSSNNSANEISKCEVHIIRVILIKDIHEVYEYFCEQIQIKSVIRI